VAGEVRIKVQGAVVVGSSDSVGSLSRSEGAFPLGWTSAPASASAPSR
jgi:hypothetical protein